MQRHVFSHAIVNMGFHVVVDPTGIVSSATIVLGGATATIQLAAATAHTLVGHQLDQSALNTAAAALEAEIDANPSTDEVNSSEYRKSLAMSFLYKFFLVTILPQLPVL